ncbi:c-type cytochrome domain-containing protein [Algoriphagus sp. D3-2-R+10]|uniref:c-type cytochrome domain-containing protein n=1 Tax=Algoriphagus aurantiacus TaxID=3103948 RepID=UPI002B3A0D6F|nr:c-type cytochrome domain-containing protein [Algoriphagus sp. D3-2-R+10]MEB2777996.1 c-type cytochrome domain-containing protein [Algoriphagus sp. D3-2-R+10]
MIDFVLPLFGRFHPILVHLPIGFLVFGVILIFWSGKNYSVYSPIIQLAFLLGGISALLASISGLLHYQNEGYSWDTVNFHLILGIFTTILSVGLWYHLKKVSNPTYVKIKGAGLLLVLTLTGHLGGNITHGDDYFTEVLPPGLQAFLGGEIGIVEPLELPADNWEEVGFYTGAIQPILDQNCKSCHNPKKLKGELDLSSFKGIQKGGEDGSIMETGNPEESPLVTRLVLPEDHDDHMPPKDKRQPRKEEIELIKAWIESGSPEKAKLGESAISVSLVEPFFKKNEKPFYPVVEVPKLSQDSISKLRDQGFFAEIVKMDSPFLKISCINFPTFSDSDWHLLQSAKDQIVYLDLTGTAISDEVLTQIATLPNLTVLKLNQTSIEGSSLGKLSENKNLKLLYINNTEVAFDKLASLGAHPTLEKVFAFETPVADSGSSSQFSFHLETGNLTLPPLPTDTIVY